MSEKTQEGNAATDKALISVPQTSGKRMPNEIDLMLRGVQGAELCPVAHQVMMNLAIRRQKTTPK